MLTLQIRIFVIIKAAAREGSRFLSFKRPLLFCWFLSSPGDSHCRGITCRGFTRRGIHTPEESHAGGITRRRYYTPGIHTPGIHTPGVHTPEESHAGGITRRGIHTPGIHTPGKSTSPVSQPPIKESGSVLRRDALPFCPRLFPKACRSREIRRPGGSSFC